MNTKRNIKLVDNGIGSRLRELRHYYNLSLIQFASKAGLSHIAILNIESGETKRPRNISLKNIISAYGTSFEWLYYGIGDMLPYGLVVVDEIEGTEVIRMKSCSNNNCAELEKKNKKMEKKIERLWQLINHLTQQQMQVAKFS